MSWSYRIVRSIAPDFEERVVRYAIHEAYYKSDDKKKNIQELDKMGVGWTEGPAIVESLVEENEVENPEAERKHLKQMLRRMLKACDNPILDEEDEKTWKGS